MEPDDYVRELTAGAQALGLDTPWAISCAWQMARSIATVRLQIEGWWVAIDHPDTLRALSDLLPPPVRAAGLSALTIAHAAGEDRALTTYLAQAVRVALLDDGSQPLGIAFESKTLYGRCWAYWDRSADDGLQPSANDPSLIASHNVDTPALRHVAA